MLRKQESVVQIQVGSLSGSWIIQLFWVLSSIPVRFTLGPKWRLTHYNCYVFVSLPKITLQTRDSPKLYPKAIGGQLSFWTNQLRTCCDQVSLKFHFCAGNRNTGYVSNKTSMSFSWFRGLIRAWQDATTHNFIYAKCDFSHKSATL